MFLERSRSLRSPCRGGLRGVDLFQGEFLNGFFKDYRASARAFFFLFPWYGSGALPIL